MFNFFNANRKKQFLSIWKPVLLKAKTQIFHKNELPEISKKDIWFLIEEWNQLYEQSNEEEKTGLSVLAYQLEIHRYAAAMLIDGKSNIQISGIVLLGYMGDESAWPLLKSLMKKTESGISQAARLAMQRINEGRAKVEINN